VQQQLAWGWQHPVLPCKGCRSITCTQLDKQLLPSFPLLLISLQASAEASASASTPQGGSGAAADVDMADEAAVDPEEAAKKKQVCCFWGGGGWNH
jgi:hypothetical protein